MGLREWRSPWHEDAGRLRARALDVLDTVPGLQRTTTEMARVKVIDRSMVMAAQALLALVPLVVVLAAFLPEGLSTVLLARFQDVTGVGSPATTEVRHAMTPDQVRAQTGAVGLVVTVLSATSFARALQRLYERVWETAHLGGVSGAFRSLVWLVGWLVVLQSIGLLGLGMRDVGVPAPLRVTTTLLAGALLWWWTARFLLRGRRSWRSLLPGAALTGVLMVVYVSASALVMPPYVATSSAQLGTLGLILAVTTWLIGFSGVIVVAAVIGRVLAEDVAVHDALRGLVRSGPALGHRRSGQHLEHQQDDPDHPREDQGEGARRGRRGGVPHQGRADHEDA